MTGKQNMRPSMSLGTLLLRAALVLVCLVMLSFHMMSGLFAKYTATGQSSDSARVAKFDVAVTGPESDNVNISYTETGEGSGTYAITIVNNSEVAVEYTLQLDMVPVDGISAQFQQETGTIAPNATLTTNLQFTVNVEQLTEDATGTLIAVSQPFKVLAHVEQVD